MPHDQQYLYLTTTGRRTGQPRKIEIWFTRKNGRFYVIAEHGHKAQWVQNLLVNTNVKWSVNDVEYLGTSRVLDGISDESLIRTVQKLSRQKYGWGDGLVVQLTPDTRETSS